MTGQASRRVLWIPIVHTQADLGSMSDSVRQVHIRQLGPEGFDRHQQTIRDLWLEIERAIEQLPLDYSRVYLYQDGLPNSGHEAQIVADLARAGSHNHRLLLQLMEKGARLIGTESPELLLEEYELARQVLMTLDKHKATPPSRRHQELSRRLLDQRDRYIASRIEQTLTPGATGLVFLGMLHSLEGRLPADIELCRLQVGHEVDVSKRKEPKPRRPRW